MNKTKIEWVKNPDGTQGYTWNPITGCLNHTPEGLCLGGMFPCYAYKLANGRLKSRYLANYNIPDKGFSIIGGKPVTLAGCGHLYEKQLNDPFYPRFWEDRLNKVEDNLWRHKKPLGIFVCDMSDLFGIGIPDEWTERVLKTIRIANSYSQHRFYLLTKQPQNLIKFSPFPENCWVGVTAITNANLLLAIGQLERIQAKVKYLSLEPLLYELDGFKFAISNSIDWVIIGAQTKPYKPPKIEWVQEIALACTKAHIPLFLKDNLKSLLPNRMPFWAVYNWKELDKGALITMSENRYRQEMPK